MRAGDISPTRRSHEKVPPQVSGPADKDEVQGTHALFEQPWWLDAVAPGRWGVSVVENGGEIAARLPYAITERFGLRILSQPPLTTTLGPWLRPTPGKYVTQLETEKDLLTQLIAGLPRHDAFRQTFAPAAGNALPFMWAGFQASIRYTYRIPDLSDVDAVWSECAHSVRRHVRKAEKGLQVRTDLGVDTLLRLNRQIFERQGLTPPFAADVLRRLDAACARRGHRQMFFAVDEQDRVHAAAFLVHDPQTAYLLTSGVDTHLRSSGAQSLLVWEAIRYAATVSRTFDFAGSMLEQVERFNRSFGARQTPYLFVERYRPHVRPLLAARDHLPGAIRRGREELRRRAGR